MLLQVIRVGRERYTIGEALFQPSILGLEAHGIVEQLVRCISTVSSENHRQLLENTVLCGATTSMTGEVHDLILSFLSLVTLKFSFFPIINYCLCDFIIHSM